MRYTMPAMILGVALSLVAADTAAAKPGDGARGARGQRSGGAGPLLAALDTDGDRSLSASEIAQASSVLASFDADGDGVVSMDELGRAGRNRDGAKGEQRKGPAGERRAGKAKGERGQGAGRRGGRDPQAMLERVDANGDGVIDKSEAPERMLERWDRADANGDGQIDQAEQAKMIEHMKARMQEGGRRGRN